MTDIALVFALVFAVNLLPAFGPPTWAVLVGLHFALDVHPVALVAAGALGAACGRWALAHGAWLLRRRLSDERRASLEALAPLVHDADGGIARACELPRDLEQPLEDGLGVENRDQ
jgi:hypothetical protein